MSRVEASRGLRSDAARNREAIVTVAQAVFAESGIEASMNEIARRAGVGIATLFRRFSSRDELIAAVFADKIAAYVDAIDQALADPDPWRGFRSYLETALEMQAADRSFTDVLTISLPSAPQFASEQRRAARGLPMLIERAQAAGRLRKDFVHQDVAVLFMAVNGVAAATRDIAPDSWRRLAALMLQALTPESAQPLPDPPSTLQIYRAFTRRPSPSPLLETD